MLIDFIKVERKILRRKAERLHKSGAESYPVRWPRRHFLTLTFINLMKLCSSLSCSTLVKSNEFCVQAFAVLFDFSKVERVLCSSLCCPVRLH